MHSGVMGTIGPHMGTTQACKTYSIVSCVGTGASLGRPASTTTYSSLSPTIYYYLLLRFVVAAAAAAPSMLLIAPLVVALLLPPGGTTPVGVKQGEAWWGGLPVASCRELLPGCYPKLAGRRLLGSPPNQPIVGAKAAGAKLAGARVGCVVVGKCTYGWVGGGGEC